ncbi:universal stress protein [Natrialbaceae archaeon AArc-T1-2]|uniref:universal stress protein n=1 Tax=Natrialbaceae archaeon AArc-T1-2 TaxID=3053904 RepID=UPI00255ADE95|nr:universal stress protein [Natrialbaceae archaeon AArc-T1-2]WIV66465.1 universal stress protein [Natrialbaceae archaeon AArc-T1-2]
MNASESFAVDIVLTPVDGSEESATAVEYAVAVADRYDASVHALYVLGRGVVEGMNAGALDEDQVAENAREFLADVEAVSADHAVPSTTSMAQGFSPTRKTRHPGSVVLDAAEAVSADFIVVPRESTTDASPDVLERAAEYVLAYASQPVLSV